ncbi:MAG: carboxymuconolactone decarboxylase family protein [SAR324 cluster bacterium]|nr:carboxymuconolactone decarboxylase family protein [SAR324 cluster bacterium]
MSIKEIRSDFKEYAKDIKINLGNILTEEKSIGLSQNQIYGIALACVYTTRHEKLIEAISKDASASLSEAEIYAAKAASTIMAMNNVYYRAIHFVSDKEIAKAQSGMRMSVIGKPGISHIDFELYSLAVSAINGCGYCIESHASKVAHDGISREGVQSTLRIASVINATAQAMVIN